MTWDVLFLKQEDKVHFKVGFVLLFFYFKQSGIGLSFK